MLSPTQIEALVAPYKIVPRGTIQPHPAENTQNAPRGTIRVPRRRDLRAQNAPRGTISTQNAPRGTNPDTENTEIAPSGTIQPPRDFDFAPRGTISPQIDWPTVHEKLSAYLDLIIKWNARTNLTAIRSPEQIVQRHFGESIFAGLALAQTKIVPRETFPDPSANVPRGAIPELGVNVPRGALADSLPEMALLDFGSGAGFPGLPIQLLYPTLHVTLAESQGKKAAFLREAIRVLGTSTEIWANRVEAMPPSRRFDVVTLRAVDNMEAAVQQALIRTSSTLAILTTSTASLPSLPASAVSIRFPVPNSADRSLLIVHLNPVL